MQDIQAVSLCIIILFFKVIVMIRYWAEPLGDQRSLRAVQECARHGSLGGSQGGSRYAEHVYITRAHFEGFSPFRVVTLGMFGVWPCVAPQRSSSTRFSRPRLSLLFQTTKICWLLLALAILPELLNLYTSNEVSGAFVSLANTCVLRVRGLRPSRCPLQL